MIGTQIALIKRELWEHRAIYVTPLVVGAIVSLMFLSGQTSFQGENIEIALVSLSNLGDEARATVATAAMLSILVLFALAMSVLAVFYTLDSLYSERKDKSILFWRSIPVTDFETVLSKLLTVVLVIPLVTFAVLVATHLLIGLVVSIFIMVKGASAWHIIWQSTPFFSNWAAMLSMLLGASLWMSPFVGWFLLVSVYTKRMPFLLALLPIAILPMLENKFFESDVFFQAFFVRVAEFPLFKDAETLKAMFADDDLHTLLDSGVSLTALLDFGAYLSSPGLWLGLVVCGLFTTAAIYVRRYRDDS